MRARLYINPINVHNIHILLILWLDRDLASERKSAPGLENKRSITNSDWF